MEREQLAALLQSLIDLPGETDWVEFKVNNDNPLSIGKYVSALANNAIFCGKERAYFVLGVEDSIHTVVGTTARLFAKTVGSEKFLFWLQKQLSPRLTVEHCELDVDDKHVEFLIVDPAYQHPVRFKETAYIRVDSNLQPLTSYPQREAKIWLSVNRHSFERQICVHGLKDDQLKARFFIDEMALRLKPSSTSITAIKDLCTEDLLFKNLSGGYDVSNLLAVSAVRIFPELEGLERRAIRVIKYSGTNRISSDYDRQGDRGYAMSFDNALAQVMTFVPYREEFEGGLRTEKYVIPRISIREILSNAIVHQDFSELDSGPVVEVFTDRIVVTNRGTPLVDLDRFVDAPSKSRNQQLAQLFLRIGYSELRGSGIDRAFEAIETEGLPPPMVQVKEGSTVVTIFGPRPFSLMTKAERLRACYWHACLKVEDNSSLSNASLRARFRLSDKQYGKVSEVIREACTEGQIVPLDPNQAKKNARYVPYWYKS